MPRETAANSFDIARDPPTTVVPVTHISKVQYVSLAPFDPRSETVVTPYPKRRTCGPSFA